MENDFSVQGVTIQSGPMVRYSDAMATTTSVTCAKWRRKKRKRKQKRPPALVSRWAMFLDFLSHPKN